jgi:hypothetical protein
MHSAAGDVRFCAARERNGFALRVEKDGAMALTGAAPDGVTLLRRSQRLRAALEDLGYGPSRLPRVAGGPGCGSSVPLPPSLIDIFRD